MRKKYLMEHFKSKAIFEQPLKVDRELGVIHDVVIVQEGVDKDSGYFDTDFINALVNGGNAQSKGVKSRFGHPNMCKTTLGTFIGRYKNFRVITEDDKQKAIADLHLDEITKKTQVEGQGISYFDYICDMAEKNSDMFGNSIHFKADVEYIDYEMNGEAQTVERYIYESLVASDLVDSPAATDELFKSSDDFGVLGTQFLDENPAIFKALEDNPTLIEDFFKRYKSYLKHMNILKKVKQAVGKTKDVDLTLADGSIATVQTDNEKPQVGDSVVDSEGTPLADGEHLLPDGGKMVTEGGKITEMTPPEKDGDGEEKPEPEVEQLQKEHNALLAKHNKLQKKHDELSEAVELLADEFTVLRKNVKSSFKVDKGEGDSNLYKQQGKDTLYDKIKSQREARKSKED